MRAGGLHASLTLIPTYATFLCLFHCFLTPEQQLAQSATMSSPHRLPPPSTTSSEAGDHKPYTHDDSCIQVRFDPQFRTSHRRKESLSGTLTASSGGSSAFLHKILGNWDSLRDEEATSEAEDEHEGVHAGYLKSMTRSQLHDMVLGLREMGRKYGMCHCVREWERGEGWC